jgi:hypothetical protein
MGQHRQLQQLNAQHEMLSMASQKPSNPSLQQQQQQQLSQIVVHIQQTKKEIMNLQKQIDVMQNEYVTCVRHLKKKKIEGEIFLGLFAIEKILISL